jgi:hypothetical protein
LLRYLHIFCDGDISICLPDLDSGSISRASQREVESEGSYKLQLVNIPT